MTTNINKFVQFFKKLESRIDIALISICSRSISLSVQFCNEVQRLAAKADGMIPVIDSALSSPLAKAIAAELPSGEAVRDEVIAFLNASVPELAKLSNPVFISALEKKIAAVITSIEHGAQKTLEEYEADVAHVYASAAVSEGVSAVAA